MPRPPRPDQPLQLIHLDPDQLVHPPVAPHREQLSAKLHCAPSHPESEDTPVWLKGRDGEAAELVVRHGTVWQLHYELIECTAGFALQSDALSGRTDIWISQGGSAMMTWNLPLSSYVHGAKTRYDDTHCPSTE